MPAVSSESRNLRASAASRRTGTSGATVTRRAAALPSATSSTVCVAVPSPSWMACAAANESAPDSTAPTTSASHGMVVVASGCSIEPTATMVCASPGVTPATTSMSRVAVGAPLPCANPEWPNSRPERR